MKPVAARQPGVLEIFVRLLSHRWMARWQEESQRSRQDLGVEEEDVQRGTRSKARKPASQAKRPKRSRGFYERLFSLRVTLWYLVFQRLDFDGTLAAVVQDLRGGGADRLGRRGRRRLSRRVRSAGTSAYHQARQRMPLELLQAALAALGRGMLNWVGWTAAGRHKPAAEQRPRQLLDGSTLAMLATPELTKEFPPASNQRGTSDWCLMRIVVGFCARSGMVLSAIGGALAQSEQALAWVLMRAGARWTLWIGDRNFGVWSVVAQAAHLQQDVLVRLTRSRGSKLCRGHLLGSGQERRITWTPSRHDQVPPGVERQGVEGRLIYLRLRKAGKSIDLWLFTTLEASDAPLAVLVTWYGQRWQAELHFRSLKTQMHLGELDVSSPAMARKEFYAGLLAYSLVRAVMWEAGERLESRVQALSFSQARRVFCQAFQQWGQVQTARRRPSLQRCARQLLEAVAAQTLPRRRKARPSEVRQVRYRREKFPPLKGCRAQARKRWLLIQSSVAKSL